MGASTGVPVPEPLVGVAFLALALAGFRSWLWIVVQSRVAPVTSNVGLP